jgi:hypothetical protein
MMEALTRQRKIVRKIYRREENRLDARNKCKNTKREIDDSENVAVKSTELLELPHDLAGATARLGKMLPTRLISAPTPFNFSSMFS